MKKKTMHSDKKIIRVLIFGLVHLQSDFKSYLCFFAILFPRISHTCRQKIPVYPVYYVDDYLMTGPAGVKTYKNIQYTVQYESKGFGYFALATIGRQMY